MKKARMNISHSRLILSKLKIFGEIGTTLQVSIHTNYRYKIWHNQTTVPTKDNSS